MAAAGEVLRQNFPESLGACHSHGRGSPELHVLAVDDSLVDRKVIEKLLKSLSCKVTAVESARRALQYLGLDGEKSSVGFDALKVNLIMTDYSMPGMTGYELLKKIKGSSTFREIPVVIMSSETILGRINSCLEEGAEDFLAKPVKLSDVERLTRILTRESEDSCDDSKEDKTRIKRKLQTDDSSYFGESPPAVETYCSDEIPEVPSSSQPSSSLPDQPTLNSPKRVRRLDK